MLYSTNLTLFFIFRITIKSIHPLKRWQVLQQWKYLHMNFSSTLWFIPFLSLPKAWETAISLFWKIMLSMLIQLGGAIGLAFYRDMCTVFTHLSWLIMVLWKCLIIFLTSSEVSSSVWKLRFKLIKYHLLSFTLVIISLLGYNMPSISQVDLERILLNQPYILQRLQYLKILKIMSYLPLMWIKRTW